MINIKAKKSCSHDQLSTELLNHILNPLIQFLTHEINQMINTGLFSDNSKTARVKPLYKKGAKSLFTNYRPISLLPAISKMSIKLFSNNSMNILRKMMFSSKVIKVFDLNTRLNWPP